jgi:hypothetical protein
MGFRGRVTRSTLADANERHDWRIFADFAQHLIGVARPLYAGDALGVDLDASLYALDSTTIDLCLALFPWARFRRGKRRRQTAHAARSSRQYPGFSAYFRRKTARCPCPRPDRDRARSLLCHGPRLPRFRAALSLHARLRVLRHADEKERSA